MADIRCILMGEPSISIDGKDITGEFSRKALAILIFILCRKDMSASRDQLINMFWNQCEEKAARYNLRHSLWCIRRVLRDKGISDDVLITTNQRIALGDNVNLQVDIHRLDSCLSIPVAELVAKDRESVLDEIIQLSRLSFLEGFFIPDGLEFNDWVYYTREEYQRGCSEILGHLADIFEEEENFRLAAHCQQERIRFNPYDDEINYSLIRLLKLSGDYGSVIDNYKRYEKSMRADLNLPVGDKVRQLISEMGMAISNPEIWRFEIKNVPFGECEFSLLADFVETVVTKAGNALLKNIGKQCVADISRICPAIIQISDISDVDVEMLSTATEKLRIFKALYKLLEHINNTVPVEIEFVSNTLIDNVSQEFFEGLQGTQLRHILKNW